MERDKLEAWADDLLEQHRTAPRTGERPATRRPSEQDRMAALLAEAGAAPTPDLLTYRRTQTAVDPDAWVGKARMMAAVLIGVLVMGFVLALAAG